MRSRKAHRLGTWLLALAALSPLCAGGWPPPSTASQEAYADPANWPADPLYKDQWYLFGFAPAQLALSVGERAAGIGASVDRAWSVTRGDPRVAIALLSSGVQWSEKDLVNRWALSRGELPPPTDASGNLAPGPDPHDRNGDGRFNVQDFTSVAGEALPTPDKAVDPRLSQRADRGDANGNGLIDPGDLILLFADGKDSDANGFLDDVCGWDFAFDDNDATDDGALTGAAAAGTLDALAALAQANDGFGLAGACPDCSALPLRASAAAAADEATLAAALSYALSRGAKVAAVGVGALSGGEPLQRAVDAAYAGGMAVVTSGGEPLSFRADAPSSLERTLVVRAISFDGAIWPASKSFLDALRCSARGGQVSLAVPTERCGAGAAALAAGVAGLALSAGSLTAGELHQLLSFNARSFGPGSWTVGLGRGRLDARAAVDAVVAGRIPASVEIASPARFSTVEGPFEVKASIRSRAAFDATLEAAGGLAPDDTSFRPFGQVTGQGAYEGAVGSVDPAQLTMPSQLPGEDPHAFAITVRLAVRTRYGDSRGEVRSEARKTVFVRSEPRPLAGFPRHLPGAGAVPPRLVDLDLDGSDELVVAAGGTLHVLSPRDTQPEGSRRELGPSRLAAHAADGGSTFGLRQTIGGAPAFADLNGDGRPEIIAASLEGELWAFEATGAVLAGFPMRAGSADGGSRGLDPGFSAAPVVADTPQGPIIVLAGRDGLLYALGRDGLRLPGFPFDVSGSATDGGPSRRAPFLATPAAADFDGDGWPELVAASAEVLETGGSARAYAVSLSGAGPSLRQGWPVILEADAGAGFGRGALSSPIVADFDRDGRREIALQAAGGPLALFDADGRRLMVFEGATGPVTHPSAADLNGDGLLELIAGGVDSSEPSRGTVLAYAAGARLRLGASSAPPMGGFPFRLSDLQEHMGFALADLDGDRSLEIISSGSGMAVTAVDERGSQPKPWPRFAGGPVVGSPAVGVVDDEVVVAVVSQTGLVQAWRTGGFASDIRWDGFHHDARNTGDAEAPLPDRPQGTIGLTNPPVLRRGCCSGAPGALELFGAGLLLAWLRTRSRLPAEPGAR